MQAEEIESHFNCLPTKKCADETYHCRVVAAARRLSPGDCCAGTRRAQIQTSGSSGITITRLNINNTNNKLENY